MPVTGRGIRDVQGDGKTRKLCTRECSKSSSICVVRNIPHIMDDTHFHHPYRPFTKSLALSRWSLSSDEVIIAIKNNKASSSNIILVE